MHRAIYMLILMICTATIATASYKEVSFTSASLSEAKKAMIETGQYTLIYFTADWCLPCQVLQESHFRDERVIDYINKGFVSIKADYSETSDIEWYDTYEVRMLPTLLIIDQQGNEIDRIQNIRNTRQLYLFLHQYGSKKTQSIQKPLAYKIEDNYKPSVDTERHVELAAAKSYPKAKAVLASYKEDTGNIYAVDIETYKEGLSIQFGAYNKYGHALNYLKELQDEGISVSILEEYVKGRKYYKVVQRVTKYKVEQLYDRYQSQGIDCFIRPAKLKS